MGCGFALVAGRLVASVVIPLGLVFYFGYYLRYKERVESERLEGIYGDAFRAYRAAVPAIVPRLSPWHPPSQTETPPWRLDRVLENDEQTACVYTVLALAAIVAIWFYRGTAQAARRPSRTLAGKDSCATRRSSRSSRTSRVPSA